MNVADSPVEAPPYRSVPPPEPEPIVIAPPPPRRWPVLGPALSTYALLLWSYVVLGQLTTTLSAGTPLGEGKAFFFVFAITSAAWIVAIRRSRAVAPPASLARLVTRAVGVAALAGFMFFLTVVFAAFVGLAGHLDFAIPFVLVLVSSGAVFQGRRLLVPDAPPRTQQERGVLMGVWMIAILVTFIAGVDLALNG